MEQLIKVMKGIAIGVANIIPGFSGGTMAVICKIYDEFVDALANLTKNPVEVIKKSWGLFVGIILGLVIGFIGILKLLEIIPLITILFFFGLVLGSLPKQGKTALKKPFNPYTLIPFSIAVILIVGLPILAGMSVNQIENVSFIHFIIIFLLGVLSSAAMVLPGLSGSMILLIFGYYQFIMGSLKTFLKGFFTFQFEGLLNPFLALLLFCLGILIGIVLMSKLVKKLYANYPEHCNMAVFGLLIASLFAILYSSNTEYDGVLFTAPVWQWIVGVVMALVGTGLVVFLDFYTDKKGGKEEETHEGENSDVQV